VSRIAGLIAAAVMLAAGFAATTGTAAAAEPGKTVTISGKTFRFGKRYPVLINALVRVREYPGIFALSDEKGDYELTVPDDANVTPYIVSGWNGNYKNPNTDPLDPMTQHYNEIDLQTFHTRGEDIVNANFQTPTDLEYFSLRSALRIPYDVNGRPKQCAIVTTSSKRSVRGVDYDTYWDLTSGTGHGIPGATSHTVPGNLLPIYFNEHVLPDESQPSSSIDGGIIWGVVPTGTYRVITEHPSTRFASFLATCAPGRVINANPPWGAYQLVDDEQPLAASNVAGSLKGARIVRQARKRIAVLRFEVGESLDAEIRVARQSQGMSFGEKTVRMTPKQTQGATFGERVVKLPLAGSSPAGKAKVTVKLTDAAGVSFTSVKSVRIPKPAR